MQMFGRGNRLHFERTCVRFEDERGNVVSLHEYRAIKFPDIRISSEIVQQLSGWLEQMYRLHDPRVRMTTEERLGSIYLIWSDGSFMFPGYAEPFSIKPASPEALNEQGIRSITWVLQAISTHLFVVRVSSGVLTWSMPKPKMAEAPKGAPLFQNPLRKGR